MAQGGMFFEGGNVGNFPGNALDLEYLSKYFGVNPGVFAGQSFWDLGQAENFLKRQPNVTYTTPGQRTTSTIGPGGQRLPELSIPSLFKAAMQDRDKAQGIADEQFARNEEAIEAFKAGIEQASTRLSKAGEESRDFMRGRIDETEQRNLEEVEGVKAVSEENVREAEADEEKYLQKLDRLVGKTEADAARTKREFQDVTAQKIQNQRRAVDLAFSRQMEVLEETGRGASSTEAQQLKAQYAEELGMVASRAAASYNDQLTSLNLQQDEQIRQMRTAAASMEFGAMQATQGARSERLQTLAGMAGLVASIGQSANEQRAQAEAMYLQAETAAQSMRVNGLNAVADLVMRNVPLYLPLSGVIAQVLAMANARYGGGGVGGWGAAGPGGGPGANLNFGGFTGGSNERTPGVLSTPNRSKKKKKSGGGQQPIDFPYSDPEQGLH